MLRDILTADTSSRNVAPDATDRTSRSRSRKTRLLPYGSLVREAICRQELFCKRRHSADDVSVEQPAKRRRQNRTGRDQKGRKQDRKERKQKQDRKERKQKQDRKERKQDRKGKQQKERKDDEREHRQRKESQRRQAEAFGGSRSSNADGRREDRWSEEDNPFNRFKSRHKLFRARAEEDLRVWPMKAVQMSPQPCLLCDADHEYREDLLEHIDEIHGGLQRYRNAMLMLESLCPHVVVGSEIRQYVSNYATFLRESKMDWEKGAHVSLRCRVGCAFCARSFWKEELWEVHLTGELGFMENADAVWKLLSVDRYQERWPLIPAEELRASSVTVVGSDGRDIQVLLHKRRVTPDMACGKCPTLVCQDCWRAFSPKKPRLCRFALANDMWLGRVDPLLWEANMTHEMCLALARTVATKVILRAGGAQQTGGSNVPQWDHAFHQSGYVGSAVVFHNGDAKHTLPPQKRNDAFAITFCTDLPRDGQDSGREAVSKIVELRLSHAVMGKSSWLLPDAHDAQEQEVTPEASKHLLVARGKKLLSLFDWKIWTMAKPRLWRFGDAANLFDREEPLSTSEWAASLLLREVSRRCRGGDFGVLYPFWFWWKLKGVLIIFFATD